MNNRETQSEFLNRHLGSNDQQIQQMLTTLGLSSLEELSEQTVPAAIRLSKPLQLPQPQTESQFLASFSTQMNKNKIAHSYIGLGYSPCTTPTVILRNILENPGWYTQYTPYQAEISQGRLEALINYQTMICDLTGMELSNASLLDEGTAAAESMSLLWAVEQKKNKTQPRKVFIVDPQCFPQTIAVIQTRAKPLGIHIHLEDPYQSPHLEKAFAVITQYPDVDGEIRNLADLGKKCKENHTALTVASDLLALCILTPPGELGADIVIGNAQRFGVPMGFGGPHAAFFATREEYARLIPGRLIGVSTDRDGKKGYRMSLQTREQHIRREKATSNICTAQVLLAIMSSMYAVYHGAEGLKQIAQRVHSQTYSLYLSLKKLGSQIGFKILNEKFFDTFTLEFSSTDKLTLLKKKSEERLINFRYSSQPNILSISLHENVSLENLEEILALFTDTFSVKPTADFKLSPTQGLANRTSPYLQDTVFKNYHSETEMLRYIHKLQQKDLSLTTSMIPLGSCTMKLNATSEMIPVTWEKVGNIHPFAPKYQWEGYSHLLSDLKIALGEITGLPGVSLQPNAGSQGEYAGLLVIKAFHESRGESRRNTVLIPTSAHGTNPASAAMCGLEIKLVPCDEKGNIKIDALSELATEVGDRLFGLMVTYPSTHGVFEEGILEINSIIHKHGGKVYMDGANMNAQIGLCNPGSIQADVCHLNLHKTFCIPHGGGGPGMGPICVTQELSPFLPGHPLLEENTPQNLGTVSAAPFGSASILPISWAYIAMMGAEGLTKATQVAILNANYLAHRLKDHYPILYTGHHHRVAHEFIIDLREFKKTAHVEAEDVAKRLMDYGFHAPTVSFPVAGTLMIEPTESESIQELERFVEAMISIRKEIEQIEKGVWDQANNPLKNAPHPATDLLKDPWPYTYTREVAVYPVNSLREHKYWPPISRIDNTYGDKNLFCRCS